MHSALYSVATESVSKYPTRIIPSCCKVNIAVFVLELAPELTREAHENIKVIWIEHSVVHT
jgi:hypothetical protein